MDLNSLNSIYFLGIGGIGMSALARYFKWQGKKVSGYDKVRSPLCMELEQEGMEIHYSDRPEDVPAGIDLVVYTPAVPKSNAVFVFLQSSGIRMLKRAEMLGVISATVPAIAIAGTHGKTTITSMIAHIFKVAGIEISAFMGGISVNYNTNFLGSENPRWVIVEADEYDRSFLHLKPHIAIISSMDADHLDIYGTTREMEESFSLFAKQVHPDGALITHQSLGKLKEIHPAQKDYGLSLPACFGLESVELTHGRYHAVLEASGEKIPFSFGIPGRHNLENAIAAFAASLLAGVPPEIVASALASYKGVKRRFEIHLQTPHKVYVDDYAHHPREIEACIRSAREFFPGRTLTGIFQPHLFSRTRDLAEGFAQALDTLDEVILLDIYPARELPIEGVDANLILKKMKNPRKQYVADHDLLSFLAQRPVDVVITMGAGDIDRFVLPLKELLQV
ncbi:MAG: UDP-N-acetylmuramate--L-alanine ligase [Bacteroidales bacterium]